MRADKKYLVDMFTGGGAVAFNSLDLFDKVYAYDKNDDLIKIHEWIQKGSIESILTDIYTIINMYELSKDNKEGFLRLRENYNKLVRKGTKNTPMLYCLITHSFNYSLHTNSKGEFNAPSGATRSYFNKALRDKLIDYKVELSKYPDKLTYRTRDILAGGGFEQPISETVFFVDPPYSASISKHPYRVAGIEWDETSDRKLFEILNYISDYEGKFVFTNVLENNGVSNIPLQKWIDERKLNTYDVKIDYSNSSYQRKNYGKTREIIITNFG